MSDFERKTIFSGELQLMAWGDSSTTGPWVKFWVHPDDLEAFKLLRQRKGSKEAGMRIAAVMLEMNDEEAVAEPEHAAPPAASVRIGDFARCAVMWCKRADFQRWAAEVSGLPMDEDEAKEYILAESGVIAKYGKGASRKHLDHAEFSRAFLDRIFHPFTEWAKAEGIDLSQKPNAVKE